ncbi:hypothetical protein ACH42_14535 [Endozoicomonas sp. (ex Bugula neritina AB1)]|nr:hypothetical protein ACH42_14535 [Endozoicomonas sp. (ex Bugula neritina AB1)]
MQGQNPLDQLRPNHLPDPIGFWPPAIGWWLLAILILGTLSYGLYWLIKHWQKNLYRIQGRKSAKALYADYQKHQNPRQFANDCNRLLKQVALHAYPQQDIASLHGKQWQTFLSETGRDPRFTENAGLSLGEGRYTPDWTPDVTALHSLTLSWIKKHHA